MAVLYQATFRIPAGDEVSFSDSLLESGAESVSIAPANSGREVYVHAIVDDIGTLGDKIPEAISVVRLEEDVWRNRWLQHYEGHEVNDDIYVYPVTASAPLSKDYRYVLRLDPRDAFGDGRHPTTTLCLTLLYELLSPLTKKERREKHLLDIGTGTGILALCASLMDIGDIHAIDCDETSIAMARTNAAYNSIRNITVSVSDIGGFAPGKTYDIITANLLTGILQEHLDKILLLLKREGTLIISGISTRWEKEMDTLLRKKKIPVQKKEIRDEWVAYVLRP
ncbi:MAG TPA: 50S ribosomal protein L11 methyltransferase [Spirochaetota bacterium]|nr:50S ribosomal protein L11 methyltransferase [Spirochaetota bacterium]